MIEVLQTSLQKYAVFSKVDLSITDKSIEQSTLELIQQRVAIILPETQEKFTPQAIGFEKIGGVSFDKGCYTGQEIIARVHYRGKTKTVFRVGSAKGACRPGDPIYAGAKPCGEVINSAAAGATTACSVIIQTDVLTQSLTIHSRPFVLQP